MRITGYVSWLLQVRTGERPLNDDGEPHDKDIQNPLPGTFRRRASFTRKPTIRLVVSVIIVFEITIYFWFV